MCGITGFINYKAKAGVNTVNQKVANAIHTLMWADQLRGTDGTGIMHLDKDYKIDYLKSEGSYAKLKDKTGAHRFISWADAAFFTIGHNRSATRGLSNTQNAHPFQEGHITLVHNGTLTFFPAKYKHEDKDLDVDSRALAEMIDELGIEKAASEFYGAYACVWIDDRDNSLNIAKNAERPLGFAKTADGIFLASESYLAAWAAQRNGIQVLSIHEFENEVHYKVLPDDIQNMVETKYEVKRTYASKYTSPSTQSEFDEWGYCSGVLPRYGEYSKTEDQPLPEKTAKLLTKGKGTKSDVYPKKERFKIVKTIADGTYSVGDDVHVQITSFKKVLGGNFCTFEGLIAEPAGEELRHRVTGNVAMDPDMLSNYENIYAARISTILEGKSGFFLINVRDMILEVAREEESPMAEIGKPPEEKEAPSAKVMAFCRKERTFPVVVGDSPVTISFTDLTKCDACDILYVKDEECEVTVKTTLDVTKGSAEFLRTVTVCPACEAMLSGDFDLFNRTYDKKQRKTLLKNHKGTAQ